MDEREDLAERFQKMISDLKFVNSYPIEGQTVWYQGREWPIQEFVDRFEKEFSDG